MRHWIKTILVAVQYELPSRVGVNLARQRVHHYVCDCFDLYTAWPDCSEKDWTCLNRQCIPKIQRCDSVKQCVDGSDEQNCRKLLSLSKSTSSNILNTFVIALCCPHLNDINLAFSYW